MSQFAPATTVIAIHGGLSVPADEYKKVDGQSPELRIALARMFDASQGLASSFIKDPHLRTVYQGKIREAADEIMDKVRTGELTPHEGAQTANAIRNQIMEWTRTQSTAIGQVAAAKMKASGRTLSELEGHYADKHFGRSMNELTPAEKNKVWAKIVDSAGRSRPGANVGIRLYGAAGKTLLVASLAIAVYQIHESDDKVREAAKQAAELGSAIAAGAATMAAIGAVTTAAPVLVVGMAAFVAGVLAVEASEALFDYFWPERNPR